MSLHPRHIRAGRALIDATQHDLAKAAKLSLATLNNIEREVAHPRQKTFDKIRLALADAGVTITANEEAQRVEFIAKDTLADEAGTPIRTTLTRLMQGNNLLKVRRILFFSYEEGYHRCGVFLEGDFRQVLYMGSGLDPRHRIGLAELAAAAIAARKELRDQVQFASAIFSAADREMADNDFQVVANLPHNQDLSRFLDLFPESQSAISSAKTSDQHPLFHVLRIFGG